ncbi:MAG: hypothetical protein J2P54_10095, partial [Bradyrhizobiaceae bacterium]|nr:hypothetical protein [Bradyrhizobiaceae bacterium]
PGKSGRGTTLLFRCEASSGVIVWAIRAVGADKANAALSNAAGPNVELALDNRGLTVTYGCRPILPNSELNAFPIEA